MTYRITIKRQFLYFAQPLLLLLFAFAFSYILFKWSAYIIFVPAFVFVTDTLPAAFLHIQYFCKDFGARLTLDRSRNQACYSKNNHSLKFAFKDIQQIIKVHSSTQPFTNGKISFTNYFYYKFVLTDGTELIVTCLLANDLQIILRLIYANEIQTSFKFFPSI